MTQQELEKYLWGGAKVLRGTIDAGDYKQYIFPLLFFKRICDVYDEEFEKALLESDGDMEYASFAEHHHFMVPQEAHWNTVRETTTNVGMAIQNAMREIEKANPDTLYGIFGDASWTNKERLSDATLINLIEHFSQHKLNLSEVADDKLGNAYEYLIKEFADDSGLPAAELTVVENYMNGGGGLFATGDHGSLGSALCGNIARVKDMRHWAYTSADQTINEVSMGGKRRNDTNRPRLGDATSLHFDNQSDDVPQTIAARTFGGGMPHPLLSISTAIRPSGVIDIMPDHPHEGECRQETTFTVGGVAVPTQIIATSYVLGGSTTHGGAGKALTDPHCFPSISVWDRRLANAGRIVIDSTWHHFVNINLNGVGSTLDLPGIQSGLTNADWIVVRQYFMNIALWMSRKKSWWCWRRLLWVELLKQSQLVEASLNNPIEKIENITLADLGSIGSLAEEVLSSKFNPSFAREFLVTTMDDLHPSLAHSLNVFKPELKRENQKQSDYYQPWINQDLIFYTAVGAGFIA